MYINKTSRRVIFLNALIFAWVILVIAGKLGVGSPFSVSNFLFLFLFSTAFELLRTLNPKSKAEKIIRKIKSRMRLKTDQNKELQAEMEEI